MNTKFKFYSACKLENLDLLNVTQPDIEPGIRFEDLIPPQIDEDHTEISTV
jgi:hypothetical protein